MVPPSPRLSARITSTTYLSDTTITSDQKMVDSPPKMLAWVSGMPCAGEKVSFTAYSGLVPMSPNTTPSAARVSAVSEVLLERSLSKEAGRYLRAAGKANSSLSLSGSPAANSAIGKENCGSRDRSTTA